MLRFILQNTYLPGRVLDDVDESDELIDFGESGVEESDDSDTELDESDTQLDVSDIEMNDNDSESDWDDTGSVESHSNESGTEKAKVT